jgi:hypothetical protein
MLLPVISTVDHPLGSLSLCLLNCQLNCFAQLRAVLVLNDCCR